MERPKAVCARCEKPLVAAGRVVQYRAKDWHVACAVAQVRREPKAPTMKR